MQKEEIIQKRKMIKELLRTNAMKLVPEIDDISTVNEELKEQFEAEHKILIRIETSSHGKTESRNFRVWNTMNGCPFGEDYWVVYVTNRGDKA